MHVMRKPQQPHQLLEQELETLSAGQDGNEDHARKRIRVIKNRLSAKKSREQARDYVHKLESSLNALMAQNQSLARRLASVEFENEALRQRQPATESQNHIDASRAVKVPAVDVVLALVRATTLMRGVGPAPQGPSTPPPASATLPPCPVWRGRRARPVLTPGRWARECFRRPVAPVRHSFRRLRAVQRILAA